MAISQPAVSGCDSNEARRSNCARAAISPISSSTATVGATIVSPLTRRERNAEQGHRRRQPPRAVEAVQQPARGKQQNQPGDAAEKMRGLDRPQRHMQAQDLQPPDKGGHRAGYDQGRADGKGRGREKRRGQPGRRAGDALADSPPTSDGLSNPASSMVDRNSGSR